MRYRNASQEVEAVRFTGVPGELATILHGRTKLRTPGPGPRRGDWMVLTDDNELTAISPQEFEERGFKPAKTEENGS